MDIAEIILRRIVGQRDACIDSHIIALSLIHNHHGNKADFDGRGTCT